MNWFKNKCIDIKFWFKYDLSFKHIWAFFKDRIDAVFFCLMLLVVGIYSPRILRRLILDSTRDVK